MGDGVRRPAALHAFLGYISRAGVRFECVGVSVRVRENDARGVRLLRVLRVIRRARLAGRWVRAVVDQKGTKGKDENKVYHARAFLPFARGDPAGPVMSPAGFRARCYFSTNRLDGFGRVQAAIMPGWMASAACLSNTVVFMVFHVIL